MLTEATVCRFSTKWLSLRFFKKVCNIVKKNTPTQVFSCEVCIFFSEHILYKNFQTIKQNGCHICLSLDLVHVMLSLNVISNSLMLFFKKNYSENIFPRFTTEHLCQSVFLLNLRTCSLHLDSKKTLTQVFSNQFCTLF